MTERWKPNTCDCVVLKNARIFVAEEQKCSLHQSLNGQALLDEIHRHNKKWNYYTGNDLNIIEVMSLEMNKEQERIRNNDFSGDSVLEKILEDKILILESDIIPDEDQPQIGFWKNILNKLRGGS